MFTDTSIILVNWNLKEDTIECIDSLVNAGAAHSQIIVVDNGSTDGSIDAFRECYENNILVIESKENLGYAAGINLGILYALKQDMQWLLLLNNDTVVAEDFLEQIHRSIPNHLEYSIFSPAILYHAHPSTIWSLGEHRLDHTLLTINHYKNKQLDQDLPVLAPIDFVNGSAMMVNRKVFEHIGLFDEALFMYGEEVDLCWRAKLAGYRFACLTSARIWHKISKSARTDKPRARYLKIRNQIYFYRRYAPKIHKPFYFIYTFLRMSIICFRDVFRKQFYLVYPTISGWFEGWNNKLMVKSA